MPRVRKKGDPVGPQVSARIEDEKVREEMQRLLDEGLFKNVADLVLESIKMYIELSLRGVDPTFFEKTKTICQIFEVDYDEMLRRHFSPDAIRQYFKDDQPKKSETKRD